MHVSFTTEPLLPRLGQIHRQSMKDAILNHVFAFFQTSRDFNGILLCRVAEVFHAEPDTPRDTVAELVEAGKLTLTFASHVINPHIKRLPDLPVDQQLARLRADGPVPTRTTDPCRISKTISSARPVER